MGLQTWLPSEPPLSFMACLDVETPSIYRVLQLCLQQRRTREQLVEQGIMPPLKTPAAFHEQIRSLERARTGTFLKHKLCSRPERSELVRMHILQETQAEPSLQATQMKLKRARLADDLKGKISLRPGPMELVEKNILPVDSVVEEVKDDGETKKPEDIYDFDEDSSDASSPKQPDSQPSPSSSCTSPRESEGPETSPNPSTMNSPTQQVVPPNPPSQSDVVNLALTSEQQASPLQPINTSGPSVTTAPVLIKQSLAQLPSEKSRSKRSKESKPRVKKLKYHQYIPPDQKQELNEAPMDSAYARLLQQQQQFLQLQILSQQQQQYNYQTVSPASLNCNRPTTEVQTSCSSVAALCGNTSATPVQARHTQINRRPDHLPANLDEMKVAELKMELKLRSLPVSGTKTDLIERLKLFQETAAATEAPSACQPEIAKLTPPVSPIASRVSCLGIEDCDMVESPAKLSGSSSPCVNSPPRAPAEECLADTSPYTEDSEKDKRLHEKERQIEELLRRLEKEQKLVEELKMQLEVEKRSQHGDSPPQLSPLTCVHVKEESMSPSGCRSSPGPPVVIKREEAGDQSSVTPQNQFIISHQTENLQPVQTEAQILLAASFPANSIRLQTTVGSAATGLLQTSGHMPQKIEASAALQQQEHRTQSEALTKSLSTSQPSLILQQPKPTNHVSKCKDPPPYEDAVKQTRCMQTAIQAPTAASQQMDDLFDVLIESGEISPFIRQDPPSQDKPLPVTACVTTLPINTVLSRPPPVVQIAQLPTSPLSPTSSLAALVSDPQLESLLDNYHSEPQTLKLMEELHSDVVTMEIDLNESTNIDNMDWLDLTLSVPGGGVNTLDMSTPVGVFSSDFLNAHELHLNWD